jgi:hypothetical protein
MPLQELIFFEDYADAFLGNQGFLFGLVYSSILHF